MLKLLYLYKTDWSFLNVFQYITFRASFAALTSLLISISLGSVLIDFLKRKSFGEIIRTDGPESHNAKKGTPSMGGLLIILSTTVSTLLWEDLQNIYTALCLFSFLGFGLVGFLDDYIKVIKKNKDGLSATIRIVGEFLISAVVLFALVYNSNEHTTLIYLPILKNVVVDAGMFYVVFGIFILIATSNAVNISDGLDGLAIGLSFIVFVSLTPISYVVGRFDYANYLNLPYIRDAGELTVLCASMIGSCVGFLWFNCKPAEIFMGDVGSLSIGGLIGTVALVLKIELLLAVLGGVFVIETMSDIIQVTSYKTRKKRVFLMAPLHHHFEKLGLEENKIVIRFWILGGMFAMLTFSMIKLR